MSKVTKILFLDLKSKIDCEIEIQIFWNSKMSDSQDFKLQVRVPLAARVVDWKSGTWTTRRSYGRSRTPIESRMSPRLANKSQTIDEFLMVPEQNQKAIFKNFQAYKIFKL